jgi:serine protease Do
MKILEGVNMKNLNKSFYFCICLIFISVLFFSPGCTKSQDTNKTQSKEKSDSFASSVSQDKFPGSFVDLVKWANTGVVSVNVIKSGEVTAAQLQSLNDSNDPYYEYLKQLYGDQIPKKYKERGLGTGFIIDKEGYIITNNHVAEGADDITVTLSDNKEYKAKVVGLDSMTDLALIKIDNVKDLTPLTLGDSDKMEVGDWVIAIGNPFGFGHTVTAGIVSGKYRKTGVASYEDYLQTDAAINQGNSGGPLINTRGEVIGINSNIYSESGGSVGIGFSIPINMAKQLLPQLKTGKVVRGWLGLLIQTITQELQAKLELKDSKGALVSDVTSGGPAEKSGIKRGDVIVSFDGKAINEKNELPFMASMTPVGKDVKVEVLRNGDKKIFDLKIEELKTESDGPSIKTAATKTNKDGTDLGLKVENFTPKMSKKYNLAEKSGVIIVQVDSGSDAEAAGLMVGDIIDEIDKEKIADASQFNKKIKGYKAGDIILFLVNREGETLFLTPTISK